ncbi:MAG: carboxypeptidase-like regulatory domain-containing protein [Longimicrobiales bacterium]
MGILVRIFSGACLLTALVTTGAAAAAPPSRDEISAPAMQVLGTISGQVTDSRTTAGMASVQIYIPSTSHGTLSNSSGRFTIAGVPAGTYTVRAQLIGYAT